jgi:uncharacterized OsmC-like protein
MEQTARSEEKGMRVNGVNINDLHGTISAVRKEPSLGKAIFRARNQWKGQALNETEIGDYYCAGEERQHKQKFLFQNDEGYVLLGNDDAPNPVEFILHGLAGCITTTTVYHAAAHGIHIDELETTLEGTLDLQGMLQTNPSIHCGYESITVSMNIKSNATEEQLELLKGFYKFSPVLDTLTRAVNIGVNVEV